MIHEIGTELGAKLSAKGCPLPVIDGPESTKTTTGARERIVIEHDEDAGDSFASAVTQHKNPKMRMIRNIGVKITIYAQAVSAGSTHWEHRRRAEHVVDLVMVALYDTLKIRRNGFQIKKAGFIQPSDLQASEAIAGAVYQVTLSIERGVYDQTWAGDKRPEGTLAAVGSKTNVSLAHGPDDAMPEAGCGA
jgi:hypothetical protein